MSSRNPGPTDPNGLEIRPAVFTDVADQQVHAPQIEERVAFDVAPMQIQPWRPVQLGTDGQPTPLPPTRAELLTWAAAEIEAQGNPTIPTCEQCEVTKQQAQDERDALVETFQQSYADGANRLHTAAFELSQNLHLQTVQLAIQLAEHIVGKAVEGDTEFLSRNLEQAFEAAGSLETASVLCHPEDRAFIEKDAVKHAEKVAGKRVHIEVIATDKVTRGGCIVQFEHGSVDAQIGTQLARLKKIVDATILNPAPPEANDEETQT